MRRATKISAALIAAALAGGCGDSGSGEPDASDVDAGPPDVTVSRLTAVENPANVLSYYVSWETDAEAPTELRVDCGDLLSETLGDGTERTEHEVFVMGLAAGASCDLTAHPSLVTAGTASTRIEDVGPLPDDLPELDVKTVEADRMQPGWTLLSLASSAERTNLWVVAIDPQGRYRWLFNPGLVNPGAGAELQVVDQGVLVGAGVAPHQQIVSWEGDTVWRLEHNGHHDMRLSPFNDEHMLFLSVNDGSCGEHNAVEMDMSSHELTWQWNACEHWTPRQDYAGWAHLNTIEPVPGERAVLISSRDQDAVWKVDYDTKEIVWALGFNGDFAMDDSEYFLRQHAPEVQPDGTILILDNGVTASEAEGTGLDPTYARPYTRVVEYELFFDADGQPDRADIVWEYTDESVFAVNRSEADRLENGNTLIHYVWVAPDQRLVMREVTMEGDIVWDVETPPRTSSYRSERVAEYFGHVVTP